MCYRGGDTPIEGNMGRVTPDRAVYVFLHWGAHRGYLDQNGEGAIDGEKRRSGGGGASRG